VRPARGRLRIVLSRDSSQADSHPVRTEGAWDLDHPIRRASTPVAGRLFEAVAGLVSDIGKTDSESPRDPNPTGPDLRLNDEKVVIS